MAFATEMSVLKLLRSAMPSLLNPSLSFSLHRQTSFASLCFYFVILVLNIRFFEFLGYASATRLVACYKLVAFSLWW
ncbi:hypothetical protein ACS0TY_029105 [Phlomoides rotata]